MRPLNLLVHCLYFVHIALFFAALFTYLWQTVEPPASPLNPLGGVGLVIITVSLLGSLWMTIQLHMSLIGDGL